MTQKLKYLLCASALIFLSYTAYKLNFVKADKNMPILTVAGVVHICPENKIVLIERGKAPKGLAMFGGHVEAKESPEEAFIREIAEELNITDISKLDLIGINEKFGRDPRQHSVEVTYSCVTFQQPKAGSDAKSVNLYTVDQIEENLKNLKTFAFDHGLILKKYLDKLENCNPCNQNCN